MSIQTVNILKEFREQLQETIKKDNINIKEVHKEFHTKFKKQLRNDIFKKCLNLKDDDEIIIKTGFK